jgi:hypothetical protein
MPRGIRLKPDVAAATASALTITWTASEPTAATTQTIASGGTPTVGELGQSVANLTDILNNLVADVAAIRTTINDNDAT